MATVKFIQRADKVNERGEAPIYAQYKHLDGKQLFGTGKKVEPKHWDKIQGKVKNHENAKTYNAYLNTLGNRILKVATELQDQGIEPTYNRVSEAYKKALKDKQPEAELTRSIVSQWRGYLNSRKNTIKPITFSNQRNSLEALEAFLKAEKIETLRPESFTVKHLLRFQDHLNANLASNTVAKRLKHFKSFLKFFQASGGQTALHLSQIKYKETEGIKIYLTEEELETFAAAPVEGISSIEVGRGKKMETVYVNLEHVRDLFVIQCNTGLRISDLKRADKNIVRNKIALKTKKTGSNVEIPINPTVRAILEKYHYRLPQISEQKINNAIKAIYRKCFPNNTIQIREGNKFKTVLKGDLISTHDAIRTFITLSAERGMSVPAISKITSKTIPVITKHYLSQSQKIAEKEMEKAWGVSPLKIAK